MRGPARYPLGEGWARVDDPGLLRGDHDAFILDPDEQYVRLAGPCGVILLVPFEHRHEVYRLLGLHVGRAARPHRHGPLPAVSPTQVLAVCWSLGHRATKAAVAERLGCDERTVERTVARLRTRDGGTFGWRAFRRWALAHRPDTTGWGTDSTP